MTKRRKLFLGRILFIILLSLFMTAFGACDSGDDSDSSDDSDFGQDIPDDDDTANDDLFSDDDINDDADDDLPETGTRYPIVLAHGFMGWGYAQGFSNFYKVLDHLEANGFEVFEPWVSSINSISVRAQQLGSKIDAKYPGQRVNIIAHSQGGLDARYLISTLGWGDRVASLTTISTPHQGTHLADVALNIVPNIGENIIDWILELFGMDWDGLYELTNEFVVNEFNPANPDDPDVAYYSFNGNGENIFFALMPTHYLLRLYEGCNDGVIGCVSSTYATHLGEIPEDHFGIVGHPFGLINFNWLDFYLDYAEFLRLQGF